MRNKVERKYIKYDSIPNLCHIELTYAYNARCIFCYNPEREKIGDIGIIDLIVKKVAESQIPHVYLIGGEPSLFLVNQIIFLLMLLVGYS